MRGDFARLTFDPTKHYTGVLHQQGRVWLEADWNEHVFDRQNLMWQETSDIIGACGTPEPGTAFQISPNPDPASQPFDFLISGGPGAQGRYYVDGILCQLGQNATYLSQPDFPDAPDILPTDGGDLRALVYLEVWQRLITYLEDDALREIALGGPDTATRLKTVAQVKVLPVSSDCAKNLTCATSDQFLPKSGQGTLTTLQPTNSQPADLCSLPDPSLYTGRENHLYRVEIHNGGDVIGSNAGFAFTQPLAQDADAGATTLILQGILSSDQHNALSRSGVVSLMDSDGQTEIATVTGATPDSSTSTTQLTLDPGLSRNFTVANNATVTGGVARFKWSPDNASFALRVTAVSADRLTLTLSSLGRDTATALRQMDLVEISDDASELGPARGHLTYLAADPDPDQFTVVIADPLPDTFLLDRYLVLRRWDGWGWARAVFDAASTPDMNLGDGIHIQFGGQDLRSGDFWQFAARSADGSVEILNAAPPMGIIRHACPLAIVEWNFQILFNAQDIVNAATQIDLSTDQLTRLKQKLTASNKTFWNASQVIALVQRVGATLDQIQALNNLLEGLSKEKQPSLIFTVLEDCRAIFPQLASPALHVLATNWVNDDMFTLQQFGQGLTIQFNAAPDTNPPATVTTVSTATMIVAIEIPLYTLTQARVEQPGVAMIAAPATAEFGPDLSFIITGSLITNAKSVQWSVAPDEMQRIQTLIMPLLRLQQTLLVRVTLKGHTIWSTQKAPGQRLYLDGQAFGQPDTRMDGTPRTALYFPTGAGMRASDFESWFYLSGTILEVNEIDFTRTTDQGTETGVMFSQKGGVPQPFQFTSDVGSQTVTVTLSIMFNNPLQRTSIGIEGDQQNIFIVLADSQSKVEATLQIEADQQVNITPVPLPNGSYQLVILGTDTNTAKAVRAQDGTPLTGDFNDIGSNFVLPFEVIPPITLVSLTLNPTSVRSGDPSQGLVTLSGPAPSGGELINLVSADLSVAVVPASVTVAEGQSSATFGVSTQPSQVNRTVNISASLAGVTLTATLTVVGQIQ